MSSSLAKSTEPVESNQAQAAAMRGSAKILAVDDDKANLVALRAVLADLGRPVVFAQSGPEALRHLLREDFAIILLDVLMPGMDGYETAALIRERDRTRHIPIIFLSAVNKDTSHLLKGYAAGAVDYVFKPVEPAFLRSKVKVFLDLHDKAEQEKQLLAENLAVRAQQVETAEALQRSLTQQSLILQSLPVALYAAPPTLENAPRRFFGGNLEQLSIGPPADGAGKEAVVDRWLDRIHEGDRDAVMQRMAESLASGTFTAEYRWRGDDGKYRWLTDRAVASGDHSENGGEFVGMLLDVSDRRLLEEQLTHAQKMEAVGQMTGGIAHDFNNMLGVIIGSLDRAAPLACEVPKLGRRIDLALQAARSCADLTKRLLTFARRQSLDPKTLALPDEIRRLEELLKRMLGRAVTAHIDCAARTWPIHIDPVQLEAALVNLVVNARDAMPDGGALTIATRNCPAGDKALLDVDLPRGDYVRLSVTDTGTGMSEEVKRRAFEPFFSSKQPGKGTGLGLSSVYGFIRQSGGTVRIDSAPGEGTTIEILLPRAPARRSGRRTRAEQQPRADFTGCRVLLVEDEQDVREVAVSMLQGLGCSVVEAADASEALHALDSDHDLSVLFTDCVMPGEMDGVALASEAARRYPELPVLLTSGFRGALSSNANSGRLPFLPKPYDSEQLAAAFSQLGIAAPRRPA